MHESEKKLCKLLFIAQALMQEQEVREEGPSGEGPSGVQERLLLEVRRRLQQARGQLDTQPQSDEDNTPLDSPMGSRPLVLHVSPFAPFHCHGMTVL